jgi:hypothetical protein
MEREQGWGGEGGGKGERERLARSQRKCSECTGTAHIPMQHGIEAHVLQSNTDPRILYIMPLPLPQTLLLTESGDN